MYHSFICLLIMLTGMHLTAEEQIKAYWYVNPITRLPDFFVGVLLYQFYRSIFNKKISYSTGTLLEIGVVILFFVFYFCAADIPKVYRYSCYYWLPVSLVILIFALQRGYISRLLSNRVLVIGGEISYSFYLYTFIYYTHIHPNGYSVSMAHALGDKCPRHFCITIALSLLSYYYFEKPANRWVKQILTKKQS